MAKQENLLADAIQSMRQLWRHRPGNEVVGNILDTFDNLNFITKDDRRPVLVARRKTAYGWHLIFRLPPGISYSSVTGKKECFQDAVNAWIEMGWKKGLLHMDIQAGELPERVSYEWDHREYEKMDIPIPIGVSRKGLVVADLAKGPHLLVGGATNYGKSNFIRVLVHSALYFAQVAVIDFKRLDFSYLKEHCFLIRGESEALKLLKRMNDELERRVNILERAGVVRIQDYKGDDLPFLVLVIDEFAEIQQKDTVYYIDRLVRLARAVGIHIVAATQRPSCNVIPGDTRSQFPMRLCYVVADGVDSRMILGEQYSTAAQLPAIQGRALFRQGIDIQEVQTMHLPKEQAEKMLPADTRGWNNEPEPERKRLQPR